MFALGTVVVCFAYVEEDSISNHTGGKSNVGHGLLALSMTHGSVTLVCMWVCHVPSASVMLRSSVTLRKWCVCARAGTSLR